MTENHALRSSSAAIGPEQASRMLRVGLVGPERPVDKLLDRLAGEDGAAWLGDVLGDGSMAILSSPPDDGNDPAIALSQLVSLKEKCKSEALRRATPDASLRAMVGYFFSVAGALALYRVNISSRGEEDLRTILMDLASVAPPDWSAVFERALSAMSGQPQ